MMLSPSGPLRAARSRLRAPRFPLPALPVALVGLVTCLGCGTRGYEKLVAQRAADFEQRAQFNQLYADQQIEGTSISIRFPQVFKRSYTAASADPDTGQPIDPRRLQPPFLLLPGFKLCWEALGGPDNARLPYYCYLAVPTAAEIPAGTSLAETLRSELASKFPGAAWEDVTCRSLEGALVPWRRLTVSGPQDFHVGGGQYSLLPGRFQLYLHEAQGQYVIVGWRVPDSIALAANLDQLAELTAGTISVAPPPGG
jgi:hypothetical protein